MLFRSVAHVEIHVHLEVRPAPDPGPPPDPIKPPPPPPGCQSEPFGSDEDGSFTVTGNLEAGATVDIHRPTVNVSPGTGVHSGMLPPNRRALRPPIVDPKGSVSVDQLPTKGNKCLPLRFKVGEAPIRSFTVHWVLDSNK